MLQVLAEHLNKFVVARYNSVFGYITQRNIIHVQHDMPYNNIFILSVWSDERRFPFLSSLQAKQLAMHIRYVTSSYVSLSRWPADQSSVSVTELALKLLSHSNSDNQHTYTTRIHPSSTPLVTWTVRLWRWLTTEYKR
jgi:hypothetical protein